LRSVTNTVSGAVTRFIYDGDGHRVTQSHGPTTTLSLGDRVEFTVTPGKRITRTYYYAGGQRIAVRERTVATDELTYLHPSPALRQGSGQGSGQAPTISAPRPWRRMRTVAC